MAPQRAKNPGRSARYYAANPEARAKKNAAQRKRNKSAANREYRSELNAERRKRGLNPHDDTMDLVTCNHKHWLTLALTHAHRHSLTLYSVSVRNSHRDNSPLHIVYHAMHVTPSMDGTQAHIR